MSHIKLGAYDGGTRLEIGRIQYNIHTRDHPEKQKNHFAPALENCWTSSDMIEKNAENRTHLRDDRDGRIRVSKVDTNYSGDGGDLDGCLCGSVRL